MSVGLAELIWLPWPAVSSAAAVLATVEAAAEGAASGAAALGLLGTALVLGIRHGIDWDHIAAITDITSTTAAAEAATLAHQVQHEVLGPQGHRHGHGGPEELRAHDAGPGAATLAPPLAPEAVDPVVAPPIPVRHRLLAGQRQAIFLGTLYALGHASVVAALGLAALLFGALLPAWVDPIMGRVVGVTLLLLGIWVFVSLYRYARHGTPFRLRSRWMLVFDAVRYAWRRLQARLHGHEHVEPLEMSSYGVRTAFGVGMIHGIGAETGSQVLIIAAVGGASASGLGVPMMLAFILGLLISNTAIIVLTATGFVASQMRERIYVVVGVLAGTFSLVVGSVFLLGAEGLLPELGHLLGSVGPVLGILPGVGDLRPGLG
jgi:high-affinity nickel-transport protein